MPSLIQKLATSALLVSSWCCMQGQKKTKVVFACTCTDDVGSRYATAFRDLLASSPRYEATSEYVVGKGEDAVWNVGVRVVSIDPTVGKTGASSVLSVVITYGPLYVTNVVQSCVTANRCAEDTFASVDEEVSK